MIELTGDRAPESRSAKKGKTPSVVRITKLFWLASVASRGRHGLE